MVNVKDQGCRGDIAAHPCKERMDGAPSRDDNSSCPISMTRARIAVSVLGVVIWKVISMHACIKADARAKYRDVKEVLDGARSAGAEKIGILVDQRKAAVVPD